MVRVNEKKVVMSEEKFCNVKVYSYLCIKKKEKIMKWLFKTIVYGEVNTCYEFDCKEKAERWQKNYIEEMSKIGCYPLKGLELKVEQA